MKMRKRYQRLLWYESCGFLFLIVLTWLDEVLSLPSRIFGGVPHSNWREATLESGIVLAVWLVVSVLTKQLLARLSYVEGFLRICPWCRKVHVEGRWIPVEEYFMRGGFEVKTSFKICPICEENTRAR